MFITQRGITGEITKEAEHYVGQVGSLVVAISPDPAVVLRDVVRVIKRRHAKTVTRPAA